MVDLAPALLGAGLHEAVHNLLPHLDGGHGGILSQGGKPIGIVPAHPGFGLLRGDEIVGILRHGHSGFRRGHQAGVKADEIEFHPGILQSAVQAGQIHGAAGGELFVIPVAADRSAAVIPEDQFIAAGREASGAPLDVPGQVVRVCHGGAAQIPLQAHHLAILDLPNLVDGTADGGIFPGLAAAGIDQQVDAVPKLGRQHLLEIIGPHAAAGFQIRTAQIEHDGDGILAVSQQAGVFFPGAGGHRGIQPACVSRTLPAGGDTAASQAAQYLGPIDTPRALLAGGDGGSLPSCLAAQQGGQPSSAAQQADEGQDNQLDTAL